MVFTWFDFAILLFFIAGTLFAAVPLLVSRLIAPRYKGGDLPFPYECGLPPHGSAWTRFGVNHLRGSVRHHRGRGQTVQNRNACFVLNPS